MADVHPFLRPAISAAVETAVVETKGKATAPTTDELQGLLTQHATLINQQSTVIQQQQATILALQNAIPDQIANALTSYNTAFVTPLVQQVTTTTTGLAALTTTVGTKAASADLTALQGIVGTHTTDIASNATALAARALASDVTALTTVVGTKAAQADLASLSTTVASKAASTTVAALAGVVDTKASAGDLTALTTTVAGKALAADLATTNSNVAANTSAIALRATTAALATQTSRVDGLLNTTVPALQTDVASRLLRTGDTSTGPQMQPTAVLGGAAPRLDQTYGGLNAPIRFVTGVGATATPMLPGPLTDPTPQGRKAKPYSVILTMRTAPTVGATVTVGTTPGGSEVFSKSFLLTGLPLVNNILAPTPPVFIELPAGTTLYAKATAGTWDVEVLSYYKS